jgi:hypothetical protein
MRLHDSWYGITVQDHGYRIYAMQTQLRAWAAAIAMAEDDRQRRIASAPWWRRLWYLWSPPVLVMPKLVIPRTAGWLLDAIEVVRSPEAVESGLDPAFFDELAAMPCCPGALGPDDPGRIAGCKPGCLRPRESDR